MTSISSPPRTISRTTRSLTGCLFVPVSRTNTRIYPLSHALMDSDSEISLFDDEHDDERVVRPTRQAKGKGKHADARRKSTRKPKNQDVRIISLLTQHTHPMCSRRIPGRPRTPVHGTPCKRMRLVVSKVLLRTGWHGADVAGPSIPPMLPTSCSSSLPDC
jgi:hypothetical protein